MRISAVREDTGSNTECKSRGESEENSPGSSAEAGGGNFGEANNKCKSSNTTEQAIRRWKEEL